MKIVNQWAPVILWSALILSASNDAFSASHTSAWLDSLFGRPLPEVVHIGVRKLAHITEYSILALLAWRAAERRWVALLIVLLVAAADETLQSRTLHRTGTPWDTLLDVCAAAFVLLLTLRLEMRRIA
jgi:VanZ family protein